MLSHDLCKFVPFSQNSKAFPVCFAAWQIVWQNNARRKFCISFSAANFLICFHYTNIQIYNIIYCAKWLVVDVIELNIARCRLSRSRAHELPSFYHYCWKFQRWAWKCFLKGKRFFVIFGVWEFLFQTVSFNRNIFWQGYRFPASKAGKLEG